MMYLNKKERRERMTLYISTLHEEVKRMHASKSQNAYTPIHPMPKTRDSTHHTPPHLSQAAHLHVTGLHCPGQKLTTCTHMQQYV